jgi:hypothetical protein
MEKLNPYRRPAGPVKWLFKLGFLTITVSSGALVGSVFGQTKRVPVKFVCQCKDGTGAMFATAFRDLLASSPRYVEVSDSSEKSPDGKSDIPHWKIDVISIDPTFLCQSSSSWETGFYGSRIPVVQTRECVKLCA